MFAIIPALLFLLQSIPSTMGFAIDHQITTLLQEPSHIANPHLLASTTIAPPLANPLTPLFNQYMTTLTTYPLSTKMLTGAALATAGDAIAQSKEDTDYDVSRGTSFAIFDMIYRASQHFLFPVIVELCRGQYLFSLLGAVGASQLVDVETLTAIERSLASQLIIVPFFYYPAFFTFTAWLQGLTVEEGIERAKQNFIPLMKRNLLFWIPVQYVQFCYLPTDLQIPFLSCAGLAWTFILSLIAGSAKKYSKEEEEGTYCVIGTEEGCVIREEELFPVMFDDFDEVDLSGGRFEMEESDGVSVSVSENEREMVSMK